MYTCIFWSLWFCYWSVIDLMKLLFCWVSLRRGQLGASPLYIMFQQQLTSATGELRWPASWEHDQFMAEVAIVVYEQVWPLVLALPLNVGKTPIELVGWSLTWLKWYSPSLLTPSQLANVGKPDLLSRLVAFFQLQNHGETDAALQVFRLFTRCSGAQPWRFRLRWACAAPQPPRAAPGCGHRGSACGGGRGQRGFPGVAADAVAPCLGWGRGGLDQLVVRKREGEACHGLPYLALHVESLWCLIDEFMQATGIG